MGINEMIDEEMHKIHKKVQANLNKLFIEDGQHTTFTDCVAYNNNEYNFDNYSYEYPMPIHKKSDKPIIQTIKDIYNEVPPSWWVSGKGTPSDPYVDKEGHLWISAEPFSPVASQVWNNPPGLQQTLNEAPQSTVLYGESKASYPIWSGSQEEKNKQAEAIIEEAEQKLKTQINQQYQQYQQGSNIKQQGGGQVFYGGTPSESFQVKWNNIENYLGSPTLIPTKVDPTPPPQSMEEYYKVKPKKEVSTNLAAPKGSYTGYIWKGEPCTKAYFELIQKVGVATAGLSSYDGVLMTKPEYDHKVKSKKGKE